MDDQFWTQSGQTITAQQSYQPPQHHQNQDEQQFVFQQPQSTQSNNYSYNNQTYQSSENINTVYVEDETARAIKEEEERIQENLRIKAEQEYQMKLKRKQEGRRILQEFFNKKEEQTNLRKTQNQQKQQKIIQELKSTDRSEGWLKVSKNVGIKQGQYKGKKDVNRMRQAIIHKRDDQLNQ